MKHAAERPLGLPCPFAAGSREKINVMRQRQSRGESIFHPFDGSELCEVEEGEVTPWDEEMLRTLPLLLSTSSAGRSTGCGPRPRAA